MNQLEDRFKKFKIEISKREQPAREDEYNLAITHNRFNWVLISLTPDEIEQVIESLQLHLMNIRLENEVKK